MNRSFGLLLVLIAGCSAKPPATSKAATAPPVYEAPEFREMTSGLDPNTIVLTYHDVIEKRDKNSVWFDCTVSELESQIRWLKAKGAKFITTTDLYRRLTTGADLPRGSVLITFADNYLGFYKHALPVLRREKIPVVMFVHTGFVGSKQGRPKMNWDQLRELDSEGLVTIASQTVSHPPDLAKLGDGELRNEMVESKRVLEEELGHRVHFLAYPNGKFDSRSEAAARAAGYLMAFSEEQRPAELSPSILSVNRYVHTKMKQAWGDLP